MLTKTEKYDFLLRKYFTLERIPYIYFNNIPNKKEFLNNAGWRITLDTLIEYFIPSLGNNPFHKEVIYNGANIPSALTSSYNQFPIGSLNVTYGPAHAVYAVSRFAGKIGYISYVVYNDPTKYFPRLPVDDYGTELPLDTHNAKAIEAIKTAANALQGVSKFANYIVDPSLRWIPLTAERKQMGVAEDSSTSIVIATSIVGGIVRTIGSETGGYLSKKVSEACINKFLYPIASLLKIDNKGTSAIARVIEASKKGPLFFIETIAYELASKFVLNFIISVVNAPLSRAPGQFVEEWGDYFATVEDNKMIGQDNQVDTYTEL